MSIHVCVTQEDINKGIRENTEKCPVALAIKRVCGQGRYVEVLNPNVEIDEFTEHSDYYVLPPSIEEYINSFDNGGVVEPIEFDMEEDHARRKNEEEYEEEYYSDCGIIDYL